MPSKKYDHTLDYLRFKLRYEPESGEFYWRNTRNMTGRRAGSSSNGYREISIGPVGDRMRYRVHQLVWMFETGSWPVDQIDHINGNRSDNRFGNLREATQTQNSQNLSGKGRGVTGLCGVSYTRTRSQGGVVRERPRPYRAEIRIPGQKHAKSLGYYATAEEAHAVYLDAKRTYHAFNARVEVPDDLVVPEAYVVPYRDGGTVPYLCGTCGVTEPALFYDYHSRATCRKCLSKRQMAAKPKKFIKPKFVCMYCGHDDKADFYKSYQTVCKPCVRSRVKAQRAAA